MEMRITFPLSKNRAGRYACIWSVHRIALTVLLKLCREKHPFLNGEPCGVAPRGGSRLRRVAGDVAIWQIGHMDRDQIIAKLRESESELKAAGVAHLFLHGSYARGTEIRGSSDVDVIAEFEPGRRLSLVDMVAIENRLTELLGVRVDLSPAKTLKEPVRDKAKREAVLAF